MKKLITAASLLALSAVASAASPVIEKTFWSGTAVKTGPVARVTDGIYPDVGAGPGNNKSIWWLGSGIDVGKVTIRFDQVYNINAADFSLSSNDTYRVEYRLGGVWSELFTVGPVASGTDSDRMYTGSTAFNVNASAVRIFALTNEGKTSIGELSISAVPEPASTALFLAGLGAMGLLSRRRKTQA